MCSIFFFKRRGLIDYFWLQSIWILRKDSFDLSAVEKLRWAIPITERCGSIMHECNVRVVRLLKQAFARLNSVFSLHVS